MSATSLCGEVQRAVEVGASDGLAMPEPVIVAVARTPVAKYMGAYAGLTAVELGRQTAAEVLARAGVDPSSGIVDEVIFGQVLQAGAGQNPARQVALGAGLPVSTAAFTVNKVCGSSLKAVMLAATSIRAGEQRCILAGGMESMSNVPHLVRGRGGVGYGDQTLVDALVFDGLWDIYNEVQMGVTGETVAEEHDISRTDSDGFAARSHELANAAWENGWFDWESFNVSIPQRRGDLTTLERDEGIRPGSNVETLARLRPAFKSDGQVTAANASQLSDGAAAVLVCDAELAAEQGWEVICRIVDHSVSGVEPARVMSAPIPAIEALLERNALAVDDVDVYEHNEAFASASCSVQKAIGIPDDRFNLHGGAVAVGHPLGASGARCLITMIGAMRRVEGKRGIVALCLGGGNAVAMLVERD